MGYGRDVQREIVQKERGPHGEDSSIEVVSEGHDRPNNSEERTPAVLRRDGQE